MTVKDLIPVLTMNHSQSIYFRTNKDAKHLITVSYNSKKPGIDENSDLANMEVLNIEWENKTAYVIVR